MHVTTKAVKDLDRKTLQGLVNEGWTYISTQYPGLAKVEKVWDEIVNVRYPGVAYVTPIRLSAVTAVHMPDDHRTDAERAGK